MYFDNFAHVLHMDGHGVYVWAAYGITLAVIVLMLVLPRRRAKQQLRQVAGELRRQQATQKLKEER
ncbi:heme exporter protein CcmD [Halioglobus maricola]|uniref:Heme exporter protein D n=1 Tax=Halioglobus maricola TaxID=2601894 RepID=A0A5P9NJZ0_9GAMM|nr:heme exporter protein CcmD [Halioglobus maricola]QFU76087.1 heme exporter protein CcmD [Halioglobus maricola]